MNALSRPETIILLRWTALFALGWLAHQLIRAWHPRWRVILWRCLLCVGVAVPLMQFSPVPVLRIPIMRGAAIASEAPESDPIRSLVANTLALTPLRSSPQEAKPVQPLSKAGPLQVPITRTLSVRMALFVLWGLGVALAAMRLLRLQVQLWRLKRHSRPADEVLGEQAGGIQKQLGVRRKIAVRISDAVSSSFLTGLLKPAIILPEKLVRDLSHDEISALLAHEIAHVQRRDLFWCVGWQWVRALLWFHPLVWKIPSAHNLACEQEADRIACGQLESSGFYRQLLARLALRILALPAVETRLALNANSQIAKRLNHLERGRAGAWNWKHSLAGVAIVFALSMAVTRTDFSRAAEATNSTTPAHFEFKEVQVIVQDENAKPVSGATVKVTGFRVKGGHSADAYGWRKDFGPPPTAVTDTDGKAALKYPISGMPEEKEDTGALIFHVEHPEFSTADVQTFYVDGSSNPVRLTRGVSIEVSGYFGADHQPVKEIVPNLTETILHPEDWLKDGQGLWSVHKMSPGGHLIQLMGQLPSGEIGYSETVPFTAETGKPIRMDLELKPGIRLEGRVDDSVPRPVKNGRVMVSVRPKEFPALFVIEDFYNLDDKYGGRSFWHSYRPIAEDGSFVFESVPPGEADVVILCDGFVSKTVGELHNRRHGVLDEKPTVMAIPQAFPLVAPLTKIEVTTEPTVTLQFTAATEKGAPIEGVQVGMFPSAFRMRGMFGWVQKSSEEPFQEIPKLPPPVFSGETDKNGKVFLTNLPAEVWIMWAEHPKYQLPVGGRTEDRAIRVKFSPGETYVTNLVMQPIGTDFMGNAK